MPGIYIHVPFCRQACRYCDFYFTVSLKYRADYVKSILREIELVAQKQNPGEIDTIYLGGGTPSVLAIDDLRKIIEVTGDNFTIKPGAEITLEANPDDLKREIVKELRTIGFNRLSVGIQSFDDELLSLMRRSHDSEQATDSIHAAFNAGFENMNADLIYAIPGLSLERWKQDIEKMMSLPVTHISAYHLTFEPHTVFNHWLKKGRIEEIPEKNSIEQYKMLQEVTGKKGFEHYEISNFALPGMRSRHNSTYWTGDSYIGFGPGAHSFHDNVRSWNIPSLKKYIAGIEQGISVSESEILDESERYHDLLLTRLRTSDGIDLRSMRKLFGEEIYSFFLSKCAQYIDSGDMQMDDERIRITPDGWLRTDLIISSLMK